MHRSAHVDTFARDRLPPPEQWPELLFDLPALQFPERLNCAGELLDAWVDRGLGDRSCLIGSRHRWTYAQLQAEANRIAHVLVQDMGVLPGHRVLLRGGNSPMLAACWFAIQKAGAIAVATMPLLRAKELGQIIAKAQVSHALCDAALGEELARAQADHPVLRRIVHYHSEAAEGLEALASDRPAQFQNVDTAADDVCLIAFTSGTTGQPKGTMHFHRDVMAICHCWPPHCLKATADDVFIGSPPLAFTFGLGGL
ncbi:MAG TPA: AMP-binding protein, partial [Burkholderiaceae bacterium]|nr:AMP-binding protein [Burkholderiaceae bacterium]